MDELKLEQLEKRIEEPPFAPCFRSRFVVREDDITAVYMGETIRVGFDYQGNLCGIARITRYNRCSKTERKIRLQPAWPWIRLETILAHKDVRVYRFEHLDLLCPLLNSKGDATDYAHMVAISAALSGVKLSDELLERVFDPVNTQMKEYYALVTGKM